MNVRLPASLNKSGQSGTVDVQVPAAGTLKSVLDEVERQSPGVLRKLFDEQGKMHRYVNLYVNGDDVRFTGGLDRPVGDSDEIVIVPAISGG